jgi:hypothetical protein
MIFKLRLRRYLTLHGALHRRAHLLADQPPAQEAEDDVHLHGHTAQELENIFRLFRKNQYNSVPNTFFFYYRDWKQKCTKILPTGTTGHT